MVPARRKSSTGIRRLRVRGFRPGGVNGSGTHAEAPDGRRRRRALDVAPRLLHRDWSLPTSIPIAWGIPRESRNDSEPLIGTRACIRVRSWSACSFSSLKSATPVLFLRLDRRPLGLLDRDPDRPPQVSQADPAEEDHQHRHQRHVADHPAPDHLEPAHRLGNDRVNRLLLDVRRQRQRRQDRHHHGQEDRAKQRERADVQPAHLRGPRRLEEPVRERQHQQEDRDHHPGRPHPAVGLVDAQPGDRIQPPPAHRDQLGEEQSQDPQAHDISHVGQR